MFKYIPIQLLSSQDPILRGKLPLQDYQKRISRTYKEVEECFEDDVFRSELICNDFNAGKVYEPQFTKLMKKKNSKTKKSELVNYGLCPYCPGISWWPLFNSGYAHHLEDEHGIYKKGLIIPPLKNLNFLSPEEVAKGSRSQKIIGKGNCPTCDLKIDLCCWGSKKNPYTRYLGHFKKCHAKSINQDDHLKDKFKIFHDDDNLTYLNVDWDLVYTDATDPKDLWKNEEKLFEKVPMPDVKKSTSSKKRYLLSEETFKAPSKRLKKDVTINGSAVLPVADQDNAMEVGNGDCNNCEETIQKPGDASSKVNDSNADTLDFISISAEIESGYSVHGNIINLGDLTKNYASPNGVIAIDGEIHQVNITNDGLNSALFSSDFDNDPDDKEVELSTEVLSTVPVDKAVNKLRAPFIQPDNSSDYDFELHEDSDASIHSDGIFERDANFQEDAPANCSLPCPDSNEGSKLNSEKVVGENDSRNDLTFIEPGDILLGKDSNGDFDLKEYLDLFDEDSANILDFETTDYNFLEVEQNFAVQEDFEKNTVMT